MTITHAIYLVSDAEKATRFLQEFFGFVVIVDDVTITGDRFLAVGQPDGDGIQLQIVVSNCQAEISAAKRQAGTVDFIYQTEDIDSFTKKVESAGLSLHRYPTKADYGITAIFEDPFGNLWDVIQRT